MTTLGISILGRHAIAKTGSYPKMTMGEGQVIAYTDAPTVTIQTNDGRQIHWRADLCEFPGYSERPIRELAQWMLGLLNPGMKNPPVRLLHSVPGEIRDFVVKSLEKDMSPENIKTTFVQATRLVKSM